MEVSRRDLFIRVWDTPMTKPAEEFDISDVGLSKICRKHRIPTPPPGHWAKVAHGKATRRPALPADTEETVTFDAQQHRQASLPDDQSPEEYSDLVVRVATSGDALAPTAAATFAFLTKAKPSAHGFVLSGSSAVISCSVSAGTIQRVALVLDAIERALPTVGVRLIHDREAKRVVVEVGGERLGIGIAEETRRTETVIKHSKYAYLDERSYQYEFSGNLRLTIEANYSGRKSWGDGSRAQLEDKLRDVVVGLVTASRAVVRLREEREAQRLRWEEEAKRRAVLEETRRKRQTFADQLAKEASVWQRFREERTYVAHLHGRVGDELSVLPSSSQEWLDLASQLSQELDPSERRLKILEEGDRTPGWYTPFDQPLVS